MGRRLLGVMIGFSLAGVGVLRSPRHAPHPNLMGSLTRPPRPTKHTEHYSALHSSVPPRLA